MKKQWNFRRLMMGGGMQIVLAVFLVTAFLLVGSPANAADKKPCYETADYALKACKNAADEVYNLDLGKCLNTSDTSCLTYANKAQTDSYAECDLQKEARDKVCGFLGGVAYDPVYSPDKFTTPNDRSRANPYFPLTPKKYTYYSYDAPNTPIERDVVTVTNTTRNISGVTCRVILDIVTALNPDGTGQKTEDTTDWYALDKKGNVWYFGEIAQQFENNILVGIDGSWTTGKDGAKPGYNMLADPQPTRVYRQEFALGEAEDMARVMGKKAFKEIIKELTLDDFFKNRLLHVIKLGTVLLHTQDFSALDPASVLEEDQWENKYYAPGLGAVLIIGPGGTPIEVLERVEEVEEVE
jgi:hypothetical protein